jgi:hypothetical protein
MTQNTGGQPGGWGPEGSYGGYYAPPAGGAAAPGGPTGQGPSGPVSASEAIAFGWRTVFGDYARAALPLVVAWVAYFVAAAVVGQIANLIGTAIGKAMGVVVVPPNPEAMSDPAQMFPVLLDTFRDSLRLVVFTQPFALVFGAVTAALFMPAILSFSLKVARGQQPEFAEVFGSMQYFVPMFIVVLVVQLITFLAALLLIIPGIIVATGTSMYGFCVIDRGSSATAAIGESWRLTKGNKWNIFVYFILAWLVSIASILACCLPIVFIALPMLTLAWAHIYATLTAQLPARAA